jgi:hypothetical protein
MRCVLAGTAWLLLGAAALADTTGDVRLDAFRDVCVPQRHDLAAMQALAATIWSSVGDDADETLARVMEAARKGMTPAPGEKMIGIAVPYRREIDGRPLFLVLTNIRLEQAEINGCFLYDFAATVPLDAALVSGWLKESPTETVNEPGVMEGNTWTAAEYPGVVDLRSGFIPPGSPAQAIAGFSGVALALSAGADRAKAGTAR